MTKAALTQRQRDFLLLNIYIQMQYGFSDRAASLAQCLKLIGDESAEVLMAQAITAFAQGRWDDTLNSLKKLSQQTDHHDNAELKLRQYLEIRCHLECGNVAEARLGIKRYLDRQTNTLSHSRQ